MPAEATPVPYWIDDPLIDRNAHWLQTEPPDGGNSPYGSASCSCGGWTAPGGWDIHAQQEGFDGHMADVQAAARKTAAGSLTVQQMLLDAATIIRARAGAAFGDVWSLRTSVASPDVETLITAGAVNVARACADDAPHIAGLCPIVGLGLANLLYSAAGKAAAMRNPQDWGHCEDADSVIMAASLARTYLAYATFHWDAPDRPCDLTRGLNPDCAMYAASQDKVTCPACKASLA
jgi:hypothetical protein